MKTLPPYLKMANEAYPDNCIQSAFENGDKRNGDTLALFIVREIQDVIQGAHKTNDKIKAIVEALQTAENEIRRVKEYFKTEVKV